MPKSDGYKNLKPIKEGEVRNPTGKGGFSPSIRSLFRKIMTEEDGEAAAQMLRTLAMEGDLKALQLYIEYMYKKDDQLIEINLTTDDATNRLIERIKGE